MGRQAGRAGNTCKQARRACIATKTHMQTGTRETRARGEVGGWMLSRCQSKGAQGTGRGCTNRSGSRWGAGRLQVDSRRRDVESGCRRQQIEDNARGRGRGLGGLLRFCKRGGHTLGGRACRRSPGRHRRITPGRARCIVTVAKRSAGGRVGRNAWTSRAKNLVRCGR